MAHWAELPFPDEADRFGVGLRNALWQAARCLEFPAVVAMADSALQQRMLDEAQLREIAAALPARRRTLLEWVDGRAESGLESLLRCALRRDGIRWESQVVIPGVGRVDGRADRVIVEADGAEYHADLARDYGRDLRAAQGGYATLRLDFATIVHRSDEAVAAVRGLVGAMSPYWLVQNCSGFEPHPW